MGKFIVFVKIVENMVITMTKLYYIVRLENIYCNWRNNIEFWRNNFCGYTWEILDAGIYTYEEVKRCVNVNAIYDNLSNAILDNLNYKKSKYDDIAIIKNEMDNYFKNKKGKYND